MGLFGNNTRKLIEVFRQKSEYYSNDLGRDIREYHEDLKSDYDPNRTVLEEFKEFAKELEAKISQQDAQKLEEFAKRLARVDRSARNGINAMWELSNHQMKNTAENLREYDEFEN